MGADISQIKTTFNGGSGQKLALFLIFYGNLCSLPERNQANHIISLEPVFLVSRAILLRVTGSSGDGYHDV